MFGKLDKNTLTLAFCIALFPPLWAVAAPYIGVETGAVALIAAGFFSAGGSRRERAPQITLGFLAGDIWAVLAIFIMDRLQFDPNAELFLTLFMLGGLAVIVSSLIPMLFDTAAWLTGWAIGLTVMVPSGWQGIGTYPLQIGAAMLVGIWYVGVFVDAIHRRMMK